MRKDASRERDGERLHAMWKYDFQKMFNNSHSNYNTIYFEMVANLECLMTEKLSHELIHKRYVNMRGGDRHNTPDDLAMELVNGGM